MKVLALAAYPERIAATRFRIARYVRHLAEREIFVDLVAALDDATAAELYQPGHLIRKASAGGRGLARQLRATAGDYDLVWIQREAALVGPPIVEAYALARRLPIVVDYDDAVWMPYGGAIRRASRFAWKFDWTIRRAAWAIAGSETLARRATGFRVPVTVLPTTVERDVWTPRALRVDRDRPLLVGWVGTHSTAPQLALAAPALRRLREEGHEFRVVVVGAAPGFQIGGIDVENRPWSVEREIEDFRSMDVGLAPMFATPWHEGKCGFKQLQFMSVGVPFVSSLVGGARDFLIDEENALIARSSDDWYRQIRRLLTDAPLRERLGRTGRDVVQNRICIEQQADTLASVLREAATRA